MATCCASFSRRCRPIGLCARWRAARPTRSSACWTTRASSSGTWRAPVCAVSSSRNRACTTWPWPAVSYPTGRRIPPTSSATRRPPRLPPPHWHPIPHQHATRHRQRHPRRRPPPHPRTQQRPQAAPLVCTTSATCAR